MRDDTEEDWRMAYKILITLKNLGLFRGAPTPGDVLVTHDIRRRSYAEILKHT